MCWDCCTLASLFGYWGVPLARLIKTKGSFVSRKWIYSAHPPQSNARCCLSLSHLTLAMRSIEIEARADFFFPSASITRLLSQAPEKSGLRWRGPLARSLSTLKGHAQKKRSKKEVWHQCARNFSIPIRRWYLLACLNKFLFLNIFICIESRRKIIKQ